MSQKAKVFAGRNATPRQTPRIRSDRRPCATPPERARDLKLSRFVTFASSQTRHSPPERPNPPPGGGQRHTRQSRPAGPPRGRRPRRPRGPRRGGRPAPARPPPGGAPPQGWPCAPGAHPPPGEGGAPRGGPPRRAPPGGGVAALAAHPAGPRGHTGGAQGRQVDAEPVFHNN